MKKPESEDELAEYYYAHRDDEDMWGGPEPIERPDRLDVTLSVRFSRAEIEAIRAAAERAGKKPTAFVRAAAMNHAHPIDRQRLSADLDRLAELVGDAREALR